MHVDHATGRGAFLQALGALRDGVEGLDEQDFLAPSGCRGWCVGDLLVHVHLGLQEMLLGLVSPTRAAADQDAASYWRAAVPSNDPGAEAVDGVRFVRLLGSAYRRPSGVRGHLRATVDGVARAASALAPGAVGFQGHVLTTADFLATWAVELTVHHLDLAHELAAGPPASAGLELARRTVAALAGGDLPADWDDRRAVLLGTGRAPLTDAERDQLAHLPHPLPVLG